MKGVVRSRAVAVVAKSFSVCAATLGFVSGAFAESPAGSFDSTTFEQQSTTPLGPRLGRVSAQLEILQQQLEALKKVSDRSDDSLFGMRHDSVRASRSAGLARSHLDTGNPARSLFLSQETLSAADPFNAPARTQRLRLTYESLRALGEHAQAARVCLQALALSGNNAASSGTHVFDEIWNLNCALNFAHGVGPDLPPAQRLTREEFDTFAYATVLRRGTPRVLLRSVVLATGFSSLGRTRDALYFINEDAQHASSSSVGMPRLLLTRALLLFQMGESDEALAQFRRLADEQNNKKNELQNKNIAVNEVPDAAVQSLAQIQLARMFYARGQFPAAESWYRLAVAGSAQKQSTTRKATKNFPTPGLKRALKWEFALALFAQKKYDESFLILKEFVDVNIAGDLNAAQDPGEKEALKYRLTALHAAKGMTRSQKTRSEAIERLTAMLAFADTDSLFVRQVKKPAKLNYDESLDTLRALLAIAAQYEIKTNDLKSYNTLTSALRNNVSDLRTFRFQLAHVLTPADFADTGILDVHAQFVFAQLLKAQEKLSHTFFELDVLSKALWNPDSLAVVSASKHRDEIKRRFVVLDDLVSRVKVSQIQASEFNLLKSNTARVSGSWSALRKTRAQLAALKNLSEIVRTEQLDGTGTGALKILSDAEPALRGELAQLEEDASALLLEQRLLALKSDLPDFGLDRTKESLIITSESFRALYATHLRVRKQSAGPTDDEFFARLDKAWTLAFLAQKEILTALDQTLNNARAERRALLADVSSLISAKDSQSKGIDKMKELLAADAQKWIGDVSARIEKGVREYRNQVRIALAQADSRQVEDLQKQNSDFARAAEERRQWLQSLRQSVDWGLAR